MAGTTNVEIMNKLVDMDVRLDVLETKLDQMLETVTNVKDFVDTTAEQLAPMMEALSPLLGAMMSPKVVDVNSSMKLLGAS